MRLGRIRFPVNDIQYPGQKKHGYKYCFYFERNAIDRMSHDYAEFFFHDVVWRTEPDGSVFIDTYFHHTPYGMESEVIHLSHRRAEGWFWIDRKGCIHMEIKADRYRSGDMSRLDRQFLWSDNIVLDKSQQHKMFVQVDGGYHPLSFINNLSLVPPVEFRAMQVPPELKASHEIYKNEPR